MPYLNANGTRLHYVIQGEGRETLVFSHGFLMNHRMFAHQIDALRDQYRIIAFDHRGHGQSAPCPKPFGIYDLVDDAKALIHTLANGPVHFAGMSTGGFVGMRLALRAPDLIQSLTLIDTSAAGEDAASLRQYSQLLFAARWIGIRPLLGKVMPIMMGPAFQNDPQRSVEVDRWRADISALDKRSVHRFGKAIFARDDVQNELASLHAPPPTQIIVGAEDVPTPVDQARAMQSAIKTAELAIIPKAGHSSPVETPEAVTDIMAGFLSRLPTA